GNLDFKNLSTEREVWLPEGMQLKELAADTLSADISAKGIAADKVLVNTVSGGINLELSEAESLKLNSTSGGIALGMDAVPDSLSANTVSGDVALCLPEGADFTVRWNTVSGSVSSELDMKKDGDKYIFGAGTRNYELNTVSGNLRLEKKGQ
ncbi:MAG: DUF4097 domain-containing protein, partial [Lachnospiraceae bacterium]|nr:DUF4097 domain-containing protein [Lachnospiraceae bacterium]